MKKKILILLVLLIALSGCTKRFTIEDSKTQKSKTYVSNIICKPEKEDLIKIYEDNSEKLVVDYSKLPSCSNLKINSGGYEGLWSSIFVKPLAWIVIILGKLVKNYGLAIMIIGALLRIIMIPFTKKSTNMNDGMKKAQKELTALEKKYKGREDKESMMAKSQEMMFIYKKYNINPLSSCLFAFIQLPIFFAFLEAVYRVPAFFEENFWKFNLGQTPLEGFAKGNYWYVLIIILIIGSTYFSFKNMNVAGDAAQEKQMKTMSIVMLVVISLTSFSLPTAIALYWIVSSSVTIIQNYISKRGKK